MKKIVLLLFIVFQLSAVANPFFYSGRLVDNAGAPYTANADLTFRLFINGASTSCLYNNNSTTLNNGIFNIPIDFDSPGLTCGGGTQSFSDVIRNAVASGHSIELEITHNNALPSSVTYSSECSD